MQLFLENLAFYFFIFTLFLVVWRIIKKKKVGMMLFLLLAGNGIGLLIVFSSDVYQTLWKTGSAIDGYRRLMYNQNASLFSIAQELFIRVYYILLPEMLDNSAYIQVIILCGLLFEDARQISQAKDGKAILVIWALIHGLFLAFYLYRSIQLQPLPFVTRFQYYIHFFLIVLILGDLIILRKADPKCFPWLLVFWVSPLFIVAPMATVNTYGFRTYFNTNCCYILFAMILSAPLCTVLRKSLHSAVVVIISLGLFACGIHYIHIYHEIGKANRERFAIMEDAKNGKTDACHFVAFPNETYLWFPFPNSEERLQYFREFYEIPENVVILFK